MALNVTQSGRLAAIAQPNKVGDALSGHAERIIVEIRIALSRLWTGMAKQFTNDQQRLA